MFSWHQSTVASRRVCFALKKTITFKMQCDAGRLDSSSFHTVVYWIYWHFVSNIAADHNLKGRWLELRSRGNGDGGICICSNCSHIPARAAVTTPVIAFPTELNTAGARVTEGSLVVLLLLVVSDRAIGRRRQSKRSKTSQRFEGWLLEKHAVMTAMMIAVMIKRRQCFWWGHRWRL